MQSVCDRVALFSNGNIVLMGTVEELGRQVLGGGYNVEVEAEGAGLADRLGARSRRHRVEAIGPNRWRLMTDRDVRPEAAAAVVNGGGRLTRLSVEEPSLETIYTRYFQNTARRQESGMRREGSPWQGLGVVILKELSDHLTSARMRVLELLVVLIPLAALYGAIQQIRDVTAKTRSCS